MSNPNLRNQIVRKRSYAEDLDYYPTPPWVTRILLDRYLDVTGLRVWEPAAGEGHMAKVIEEYQPRQLFCSDIKPRAVGVRQMDFLSPLERGGRHPHVIITNPPYSLLLPFMQAAIAHADIVAFFARLNALEGKERGALYRAYRPAKVLVFSERVQGIAPGGFDMSKSSMQAYCWMIWNRVNRGKETTLNWIPAGSAEEYTREGDYE